MVIVTRVSEFYQNTLPSELRTRECKPEMQYGSEASVHNPAASIFSTTLYFGEYLTLWLLITVFYTQSLSVPCDKIGSDFDICR